LVPYSLRLGEESPADVAFRDVVTLGPVAFRAKDLEVARGVLGSVKGHAGGCVEPAMAIRDGDPTVKLEVAISPTTDAKPAQLCQESRAGAPCPFLLSCAHGALLHVVRKREAGQ
jgi:hypothetical protein